eukprot:8288361-Pyramimonas_sp.AAC.1
MSLRRIGYDPKALDCIVRPNGAIINLLEVPPWHAKQCITLGVRSWQMKLLADGAHDDVRSGIFVAQLRR